MGMNIVKVIVGTALIICGIITINAVRKVDNRDKMKVKLEAIAIIVEIAAGICALASLSPTMIKIMIPEQEKVYQEKEKLKEENIELKESLVHKDKKIMNQETKLKELKSSMKDNAEFLSYKLYYNDDEIKINNTTSIANINEKLYFSDDVLSSILESDVKKDEENELIYIGKYPDKTVSFLDVCKYYDNDYFFSLGKETPFEIRGVSYSNGFTMRLEGSNTHSVTFNLKGKYTELVFKAGHVDNTDMDSMVLTPYIDNEVGTVITITPDTDPDTLISIPLNKGKQIRLEWHGSAGKYDGKYGVMDAKVK